VLVDNRQGGYLATQHLIDLGHQHIACITGPSQLTPSAQRIEGYRQALHERGLKEHENPIAASDFSFQGGEKAMKTLLESHQPPTAVFVCNDMMALGAIRAIYNHGLRVPEDISVIGFDDIPIAQCVYPAITTVAQPVREMGEMVVDLLIQQITLKADRRNQQAPARRRVVLETWLIERHSCQRLI
jgi:LacI family transcriptional regulator